MNINQAVNYKEFNIVDDISQLQNKKEQVTLLKNCRHDSTKKKELV